MSIQYRALPESYLNDAQFPELMKRFEEQIRGVYDDGKGIATIGIGVNIRQNKGYLALVLKELGVFQAADLQEQERRQQLGLSAETEAQRNVRYDGILKGFNDILAAHPLRRSQNQRPTTSDSEITLQNALNAELARYKPGQPFRLEEPQSKSIVRQIVAGFEIAPDLNGDGVGYMKTPGKQALLDKRLHDALNQSGDPYGINLQHDTREYMAVMSLFFNSEGKQIGPGRFDGKALVGNGLLTALSEGNRAEAWYEIRYNSNGDRLAGIAKRRYTEAQIFGLYDDENIVTADEAKQAYRMLQLHRDTILNYEALYGVTPDGQSPGRDMIDDPNQGANANYEFAGTAYEVDTVVESFDPAKSALIAVLNEQHPSLNLNPGNYRSTDLYLDPGVDAGQSFTEFDPNHTARLDARAYDAEGQEKAVNNILIGEGGADTLEGGQGNDILLGGEGFDTYVYRPGDGEDTIVDGDGLGAIEIERDGVRQRVLLGVHHPQDPEGSYGSPHTGVSYRWSGQAGDDLKIQVGGSGTLTVKSYQPGALGIKLVSAAPLPAPQETLTGTPGDDFDDVTPPYLGHSNISGGQVDFNVAEDGSILPQGKSLRAPYQAGGVTEGWDIEAIHGLEGDDNITGGPSTRLLDGGAGNDWIKADWVSLGVPADPEVRGMVLLGGEGNDEIWASRRSALDDWIVAGPDTLPAGSDHDQVFGHGGADVILGGVGNDWLAGGNGARLEWLLAYPRPDGDDIVIGGPDEATVPDNDHLLGGAGSDYLYGGAGNDFLYGDADGGLNRTTWWVGSDEDGRDEYLFGWSGELGQHPIPLLPYSNSSPDDPSHNTLIMRYELPAQHPEGATLEAGRDTLYGGKGQDELFGGAQEDVLDGGADADKLYGEGGNDTLYGGDGADELWGDKSLAVYNEDNRLREGGSLAEGTAYRYVYRLHRDGPEVAGDDRLEGGPGNDLLHGGGGDDVYVVNRGDGVDTIEDPEGANRIRFGAGIDVDDLILGQASGAGGERYFTIGYTVSDKLSINHGLLGAFKSYEFADGTVLTHAELLRQRAPALNIEGSAQADVIEGGAQGDILYGKSGDDILRGGAGADALSGGLGSDVLEGGEGNDQLLGYEPYSTQSAQEHDTLYGGRGNDRMFGGLGDDVYRIDRGDGIDTLGDGADDPAGGFDTLRFGAAVLPEHVALYRIGVDLRLVLDGGSQQITISGFFDSSYDRRIEQFVFDNGNGPVWTLDDINGRVIAGTQNTMIGTSGDDTFAVDHGSDTVTEAANAGTDTIESWVSYTLPANVENLTLTGPLHIDGAGNALDNIIRGNAGNNFLRGGGGNDTFYGGAGDDSYDLTDQGGTVIEFAGEGHDTVRVADTYTLPDNVENLTQASRSIFTVYSTGNALDNLIHGRDNVARDVLDGRAGADTMIAGRSGSATFVVDNPGDRVIADPLGFDNDKVLSSITYTLGPSVENLTLTGAEPISGTGNELKNTLDGSTNSAANVLAGGAGDDTYILGVGDTVIEAVGEGSDTIQIATSSVDNGRSVRIEDLHSANVEIFGLTGNGQSVTLVGDAKANTLKVNSFYSATLIGAAGDDTLFGGNGDDRLDGGAGADILYGGGGSGWDTYVVDDVGDRIEDRDSGYDRVESSVSYTLGNTLEDLTLTGTEAIEGTGNGLNNRLDGSENPAANLLTGGAGNDHYLLGAGDSIVEEVNGGIDEVWSKVSISELPANVENVLLTSPGVENLSVTGNALDNRIQGDSGHNRLEGGAGNDTLIGSDGNDSLDGGSDNDTLDGGQGNDTLDGGIGDDSYHWGWGSGQDSIDSADAGVGKRDGVQVGTSATNVTVMRAGDDLILEIVATGEEEGPATADRLTVRNYFAATHPTTIEEFRFTDGALWTPADILAKFVRGTSGNDTLVGSAANDNLAGLAGDDALTGGAGHDILSGDEGADTLYGEAGMDTLMGGSGADLLDGGLGSDRLLGGEGDDTYRIDDAGDVVIERAHEGLDTARSSLSYTLGADLENLILTGSATLHGTGNALDNALTGNSAKNTLTGGAGNDLLDGKAGADKLYGGLGEDTYIVDNTGDVVTENSGEGMDTVKSSVTYTLGANLENLTLTGTSNRSATGNALDNTLIGNGAANTLTGLAGDDLLDGAAGADTLRGGLGNDTYVVDNTGDKVSENAAEGIDTVHSSITYTLPANVEHLVLSGTGALKGTGNSLDNLLRGNSAANILSGGNGLDVLEGAAGNDTLMGGAGADRYLFNRGDGLDLIQEQAGVAGENDSVHFGPGLDPDELWFSRMGDDLKIAVLGAADGITLQKWYSGPQYRVEEFHTADGAVLYESQVQQLVQAMAAFNPPGAGETELSPPMREQLEPVLAAAWET